MKVGSDGRSSFMLLRLALICFSRFIVVPSLPNFARLKTTNDAFHKPR